LDLTATSRFANFRAAGLAAVRADWERGRTKILFRRSAPLGAAAGRARTNAALHLSANAYTARTEWRKIIAGTLGHRRRANWPRTNGRAAPIRNAARHRAQPDLIGN
jgi:hypothetical protein